MDGARKERRRLSAESPGPGSPTYPSLDVKGVADRCALLRPARIRPVGHRFPATAIRVAATLVPVVSLADEAAVVVTKRSDNLVTHRGDWVFPGGGVEARDRSTADAAIRETAEELGVAADRITLLGEIDGYGPINTGHVVHVYLGLLSGIEINPNSGEVADVEIVPLSALLQPDRHFEHVGWPDGYEPAPSREVRQLLAAAGQAQTYFKIRPGQLLWGTQAEIVIQLLTLLFGHSDWRAATS